MCTCGVGGGSPALGLDLLSRGPRSATSAFPGKEKESQSCWSLASPERPSHCYTRQLASP